MIYAFFPLLAAMFYGIAFAFTESALKVTNIATYMLISCGLLAITVVGLLKIKGESLKFDFLQNNADTWLVLVAVAAPSIGWLFTTYAIKNVNASYAAFAEISYPLFTVLALFLFFGLRSLDWSVAVGGLLILAGSSILIMGQLAKA